MQIIVQERIYILIQMASEVIFQLIFLNITTKKQCSSSTYSRIWTQAISRSLIHLKSLCLKMEENVHNLGPQSNDMIQKRVLFHGWFIVCNHSLFFKNIANPNHNHQVKISSRPHPSTHHEARNRYPWRQSSANGNIFNIIKIINPKIKVDRT
jgi:hypothetical protein